MKWSGRVERRRNNDGIVEKIGVKLEHKEIGKEVGQKKKWTEVIGEHMRACKRGKMIGWLT